MKVLIMIKDIGHNPIQVANNYILPLIKLGVAQEDISVELLPYDSYKKVSSKTIKENAKHLTSVMSNNDIVLVCDTPYLKYLASRQSVENIEGVPLNSKYGSFILFKGIHHAAFTYADKARDRNQLSLISVAQMYLGSYVDKKVIHSAKYYNDTDEIKQALAKLHQYPKLAADIEGRGLKLDECGVSTIAFSWDEHNGIAICIDYTYTKEPARANVERRMILKEFLESYQGTFIWHGSTFDIKQLVANLWMQNDLLDYVSMTDGIEILTKKSVCTKDMAYLCTNSTEGNTLSLKHLASEFTGEYAIEVEDITVHPIEDILEYNLIDTMATFWLYKKYLPILKERNQEEVYWNEFQPNNRLLITAELHGMPLNMSEVLSLGEELQRDASEALDALNQLSCIEPFIEWKQNQDYLKYKKSVKVGKSFNDYIKWKPVVFNPNSGDQVSWILHNYLNLPIVDVTPSKSPSTGSETLEKHLAYLKENQGNAESIEFVERLLVYSKVTKISDFIKAFLKHSILKQDGVYYLHGSIKQGSTISSRLASSDPNTQNLPSGGHWGKAIKKCFSPPKGKIWLDSDYNSLEIRISALLSKDSNMLKEFTKGLDGHSLRANKYFPDELPKIQEWLTELNKEGNLYKITYDDGSFEYLNEHNPKLKEIKNE